MRTVLGKKWRREMAGRFQPSALLVRAKMAGVKMAGAKTAERFWAGAKMAGAI